MDNSNSNNYSTVYSPTADEIYIKECTTADLWLQAWSAAGKSLFYMKFIRPEVDWAKQRYRIEQMCYHLASEWNQHYKDTPENRQWFREWLEKFEQETDNQC